MRIWHVRSVRDALNTKKPLARERQRLAEMKERFCMKYSTDWIEDQEEEVEEYDFFNEGYPGDGYEDEFSEFSGWRDLVL